MPSGTRGTFTSPDDRQSITAVKLVRERGTGGLGENPSFG